MAPSCRCDAEFRIRWTADGRCLPRGRNSRLLGRAGGRQPPGIKRQRFDRLPVSAAADYGLSRPEAREVVDRIVSMIETQWLDASDAVGMSEADRNAVRKRSILNRSVSYE